MTDQKLRPWINWPLLRPRVPVVPVIRLSGVIGGMPLRGTGLTLNSVNPALAGDELFAEANSIVGSIGVLHASFGFAEAIGRLGIERRLHTAGSKKAMLDPFRPQDPDDVARLHGILDDIHTSFKQAVRERRGDRLKGPHEEVVEG